jgi:hypothetical protein
VNAYAEEYPKERLQIMSKGMFLNTNGTITPQEAYHGSVSEDKSIRAANRPCIDPYGFLLDGDDVSTSLKRPNDRLNEVSDPEVANLLRHLGCIVQVPADFRFELTNFWALDIMVQKDILNGEGSCKWEVQITRANC